VCVIWFTMRRHTVIMSIAFSSGLCLHLNNRWETPLLCLVSESWAATHKIERAERKRRHNLCKNAILLFSSSTASHNSIEDTVSGADHSTPPNRSSCWLFSCELVGSVFCTTCNPCLASPFPSCLSILLCPPSHSHMLPSKARAELADNCNMLRPVVPPRVAERPCDWGLSVAREECQEGQSREREADRFDLTLLLCFGGCLRLR
jgi:hypothetical protein